MVGIRRALVLVLVFIAGTANEQAPSVGPRQSHVISNIQSVPILCFYIDKSGKSCLTQVSRSKWNKDTSNYHADFVV